MLGELIAEFKGKNTSTRILPHGKMETSGMATGKILGIDATMMFTNVSTMMPEGIYMGETNAIIMTANGDVVNMKSQGMAWPSANGGSSRSTSFQMTQSPKLMRLNKVIGLHEYETDINNDWTGKIWEWK
jgi:hypothetical protein